MKNERKRAKSKRKEKEELGILETDI